MAKRHHWGHALTAIGLVGALAACSNSLSGTNSASAAVDPSKVGLATRAQAALVAGDVATALTLVESAVEHRPNDASFRTLLGNIYLASGRYASAERSYHDALTLAAPDPQVVLKYALVQIGQGKNNEALAMLSEAQSLLDAADLGLALALAGRASDAVAVLEPAARQRGADARLRQNLAFALALGGDWDQARLVAAQDLTPGQVETRIAEWMTMARPGQSSAQVAAFIGIQPVADPGQPVRLALAKPASPVRQAAAPAPVAAAPVAVAAAAPPAPLAFVPAPTPAPAPVAVASVAPPLPAFNADAPSPEPRKVAARVAPRPGIDPAALRLKQTVRELRHNAALRAGRSTSRAVVQLGAYNSRAFIAGAWNKAAARHNSLRNFTPVTARFDGPRGTFYRLSVKGFASDRQAIDLCNSLKRAGANCFVRAAFNDAPVRLASR